MKEILDYINKFPDIEEVDLVKLISQRVFGPSHLLINERCAKEYLFEEIDNSRDTLIKEEYIPISEDLVQYNLAFVKDKEAFFNKLKLTGESISGNINEFNKEIDKLIELIIDNGLKFDVNRIKSIVTTNEPYRHSFTFNKAYKPHYRVIKKELLK